MKQQELVHQQDCPFTSDDWDSLRFSFKDTVMAETSLASLAKNLGRKWPIKGKEETPGRYIESTLAELAEMPEFYGKGSRLSLLFSILQETKQLDDPFVDMIEQLDSFPKEERVEMPSLLERVDVSEDFPVELMNLSRRTRTNCMEGGHKTVGQLHDFMQRSPSAVIMNDEFRRLLDCLNHMDEKGLAEFLPIREGRKGIHLAEAIGLIGRRLKSDERSTLIYAFMDTSDKQGWGDKAVLPKNSAMSVINEVKAAAQKCAELMPEQASEMRTAIESGLSDSVRYFVSLRDPELEELAIAIAKAACDMKPRFKGLIGSLLT